MVLEKSGVLMSGLMLNSFVPTLCQPTYPYYYYWNTKCYII